LEHREIFIKQSTLQQSSITEAISQSVANAALDLDAKAIIAPTASGFTARMISKYRPKAPIIAVSPSESIMRRSMLTWGVIPVQGQTTASTDHMFEDATKSALKTGLVEKGDLVVITAGVPAGIAGNTNLIKIHVCD
jgi:pyruvate kinase